MANRKQSNDFAETAVLPTHLRPDRLEALDDAASDAQGRYREYVRSLDEVPVLVDVAREPPRAAVRDFRSGQRADTRKAPREDSAALREQHAGDVAVQYAEYAELIGGVTTTTEPAPERKASPKNARRPSAQKKRAKRAKRSARSKS
jgi:hypothetical protein